MDGDRILPYEEFHEIWWIYSPKSGPWAGLRIAHFRKTTNGVVICVIQGEADRRRIGPRIWDDIERSELWYQVKQIPIPTMAEVFGAALKKP
jgi:hypothetical protein